MFHRLVALVAVLLLWGATASAQMLTVSDGTRSIAYSEEELLALPQHRLVTNNEYVPEKTAFRGPLLRHVIAPLDPSADEVIKATALNDYAVEIPVSDALDYKVIVARYRDGTPMRIRDKGPLWIIYPLDAHADLTPADTNHKLIWQLDSLRIK